MVKPGVVGNEDNLFDLYFKYTMGTEPPVVFHRWSFIGCLGALLGRSFYLPFGSGRIFPNQYIMFVGDPGTRKSTAIKAATRLIALAGFDSFGANSTSMEKFLLDLQAGNTDDDSGPEDKDAKQRKRGDGIDILKTLKLSIDEDHLDDAVPKEMFIAADEFNNFIGRSNLDFQSLLGELWDWDEPNRLWKKRLKNSKSVGIYQPTVSILSGNTPTGFAECFPPASIGQGFMSRLILIHSEPSGLRVTFPKQPSQELTDKIVLMLQRMKALCVGPMEMEDDASSALDLIYKGWIGLEDTRFQHYSTRRFTHLLKLCLVVCAARLSTRLTVKDVLYANTVLTYAESTMPKAIGELGKSKNSEAANKIMQVLYNTGSPKTVQELWKVVSNDLNNVQDLSALLVNLQQAEKIQAIGVGTKHGYLAKQTPVRHSAPFINFDILKGREYK